MESLQEQYETEDWNFDKSWLTKLNYKSFQSFALCTDLSEQVMA